MFGDSDELTGEYFDYSLDGIPALEIKAEKKWARIQQADFLTTNEKREELGYEKVEGGDDVLIQSSLIPLNTGLDEGGNEEQPTGEEEIPDEENKPTEEETEDEETEKALLKELEDVTAEGKPYPDEHACRLNSPEKYTKFRRKNGAFKINGKSVDIIYGITKDGKTEIQAIRYPKSTWTADEARADCKKRKPVMFEAASGKGCCGEIDD